MKNIALSVTPRQGNLCTTNGALATFAILLSGSGGGAVLERPGDCDYVLDGCDYENQGGDRLNRLRTSIIRLDARLYVASTGFPQKRSRGTLRTVVGKL